MVTERVRTLPTEPTEGEIVKSNPLLSFINIGQRGRIINHTGLYMFIQTYKGLYITNLHIWAFPSRWVNILLVIGEI